MASEYGGGPQEILDNVSIYEALCLVEKINDRQIYDMKMQATIASYPYFDKDGKLSFIRGLDGLTSEKRRKSQKTKLDKAGFGALKFAMSQNPKIIVK